MYYYFDTKQAAEYFAEQFDGDPQYTTIGPHKEGERWRVKLSSWSLD